MMTNEAARKLAIDTERQAHGCRTDGRIVASCVLRWSCITTQLKTIFVSLVR